MLDESPNECENESEDENWVNPSKHFIKGAFIYCSKLKHNKIVGQSWIKLSTINSIEAYYEGDREMQACHFKTYKDCHYCVPIACQQLRHAIDSFLFLPDEHWEQFSYD